MRVCLCFAEMSIYFRFGKFRANFICPIFRKGHAEFLYDFDMHMHACVVIIFCIYNSQATMKVCGRMVNRYFRSAVDDMNEKNEKEILCPCKKCKEGIWLDPFKGGRLKAHLLRYGFMDGYT